MRSCLLFFEGCSCSFRELAHRECGDDCGGSSRRQAATGNFSWVLISPWASRRTSRARRRSNCRSRSTLTGLGCSSWSGYREIMLFRSQERRTPPSRRCAGHHCSRCMPQRSLRGGETCLHREVTCVIVRINWCGCNATSNCHNRCGLNSIVLVMLTTCRKPRSFTSLTFLVPPPAASRQFPSVCRPMVLHFLSVGNNAALHGGPLCSRPGCRRWRGCGGGQPLRSPSWACCLRPGGASRSGTARPLTMVLCVTALGTGALWCPTLARV